MVDHAGGVAALDLLGQGVGAHGDDRDLAEPAVEGAMARVAARPSISRHVDVHQDDVEAAARRLGHGLLAVVGRLDLAADQGQQGRADLAVHRMVVDQQDAGRARGRGRPRLAGVVGLDLGRLQLQPEGRAVAQGAVETDLAAHQLDQRLADRQPQARAAIGPAGRAVDLAEALEQPTLPLDGDADTGVDDFELQPVLELAGLDGQAGADPARPR
jgi:hypothetical protein